MCFALNQGNLGITEVIGIGRLFGWGPADSINVLKHLLFTLATGLQRDNAKEIKEAIEKAGGTIKVLSRQ